MMLCIFLSTGRTYTFRDVVVVVDNESVLVAEYTAMSDGRRKRVTVIKSAIIAYSVLAPAEEQLCDVAEPAPKNVFGATVRATGGGVVDLNIDRATEQYPEVGSRVRVIVDG